MKHLISVILCFAAVDIYADCQVKIRVVSDESPEYYQDEQGNWQGMAIELAKVLMNEAKCEPIFINIPWKRALLQMEEGELDLMLNLSITEERKKSMYFIGPQRDESAVLVVHRESDFKINTFDDFQNLPKHVGMIRGAFYGESFDSKYQNDSSFAKSFYFTTGTEQLVAMLNRKRISGYIGDLYPDAYNIKTDTLYKDFKIHPFLVNHDWVYFGLSKKSVSKELLATLQRAYNQATAKGKFKRVLERYR